jgi:predicted transcriptional regulator
MLMDATIPAAVEVQATLKALSHSQMQELARLADVPFTTLWKVRSGETANPGIETVRKFVPHIEQASKEASTEQGG